MSYLYALLAFAVVLLLYYIARSLEKILDKLTQLNQALRVEERLEQKALDEVLLGLREGVKVQKASASAEP